MKVAVPFTEALERRQLLSVGGVSAFTTGFTELVVTAPASSPTGSTTHASKPNGVPSGRTAKKYGAPLLITTGGTYSGRWESKGHRVPAVTIATSEPVVIERATIRGRGHLIANADGFAGTDLTIRDTAGYGLNPRARGEAPGRFVDLEDFASVRLENNYLEGTSGISLQDYRGDRTPGQTVTIVANRAKNIDGRKSDGRGGFLTFNRRTRITDGYTEAGYEIVQFVQLDNVSGVPGMEIAWNEVVNQPGRSRVEDNINIYRSGGTPGSPLRIHDNYIQGAYTVKPTRASHRRGGWEYDWAYAGGGILLGDGSPRPDEPDAAFVRAYDNQVVSTTNYGIGIAAGHDLTFSDNRIVSAGRLPDGRRIAAQNVGAYIWDLYGRGRGGSLSANFYDNHGRDNSIGWTGQAGRNDWWVPDANEWVGNTPYEDPVTLRTEAAELAHWRAKLEQAGIVPGVVPAAR